MIELVEIADLDILDGLTSLVDKSLIRQVDQKTGDPRFEMLETIREFAAERLEEDQVFHATAIQAHAAYFADFTRRSHPLKRLDAIALRSTISE